MMKNYIEKLIIKYLKSQKIKYLKMVVARLLIYEKF